jgi:DMSO/TMAO reductase YedYZ heme-binding membrane subunit
VWRAVHLSSYVAFWLTAMHAAFAGSDATRPLYQITAVASIVAVAWALMYRVANRRAVRRAARAAASVEVGGVSAESLA